MVAKILTLVMMITLLTATKKGMNIVMIMILHAVMSLHKALIKVTYNIEIVRMIKCTDLTLMAITIICSIKSLSIKYNRA